jgi:hypothetical protein
MNVIATNVTRLPEDNRDPACNAWRLDGWRCLVEAAVARWQVMMDPGLDRTGRTLPFRALRGGPLHVGAHGLGAKALAHLLQKGQFLRDPLTLLAVAVHPVTLSHGGVTTNL